MSENPYETKRRWRWPRFKLSTILVLVGIAAWAMSMRPWVSVKSNSDRTYGDTVGFGFEFFWHNMQTDLPTIDRQIEATVYVSFGSPSVMHEFNIEAGPRDLVWPILALAAFLTWKWIAARRKRGREVANSPARRPPQS